MAGYPEDMLEQARDLMKEYEYSLDTKAPSGDETNNREEEYFKTVQVRLEIHLIKNLILRRRKTQEIYRFFFSQKSLMIRLCRDGRSSNKIYNNRHGGLVNV